MTREVAFRFASATFTGKIDAINPQVDSATRNGQVRASLSNPEHKMLPGMFVNVHLTIAVRHNALTVPFTAVQQGPNGTFVYKATATDREGAQATWEPFVRTTSQFQVMPGAIEIKKP